MLAPNPATDYLSIKFSKPLEHKESLVKLISTSGQVLLTNSIEQNTIHHSLNLAHLSAGTYFIVLSIDNEPFSLPFVKR